MKHPPQAAQKRVDPAPQNCAILPPGACDTPAVPTVNTYGIDFLSVTAQETSSKTALKALRDVLTRLGCLDTTGDQKQRTGFIGNEILGGRGFAGHRATLIYIDLPGQAIDALRARGINDQALVDTFKVPIDDDHGQKPNPISTPWRASRLDFCVDTKNPKITPALVAREFKAGHVTCRAHEIREMQQTRADGRQSHTTYIGSPASVRMLRVYDKSTQMEFVHGVKGLPPWARFELQHRHEAAEKALVSMQTWGIERGKKLLNGWITFTDPKSRAKETWRRPAAAWWSEIIGTKKVHSV